MDRWWNNNWRWKTEIMLRKGLENICTLICKKSTHYYYYYYYYFAMSYAYCYYISEDRHPAEQYDLRT